MKNKTVIYTAIFGSKDKLLEPDFLPEGCDFVCFTDMDLDSKIWQIKKVEPLDGDMTRTARHYKILAHQFLSDYEFSIWIDGNILVRNDASRLINKYLNNYNMAVYDHRQTQKDPRSSVYEEAETLIEMASSGKYKDDPNLIRTQVEKYKLENFPDNNGLISSMIMLRRHNQPDVIKTMEDWWSEVQDHSRRDQLSFNYVAWKNNLNFVYIDGDSRDNDFFLWRPHML